MMTNEQAFQIVSNACASVSANLQGHQNIQAALQVLQKSLEEPKTKEEENGKRDKT